MNPVESVYWTTAAFSLLATWLNIRKDPRCFALWTGTNGVWAMASFGHGLLAQGCLHGAYMGLAIWGVIRWCSEGPPRPPPPPAVEVPHGAPAPA